MQAYFTLVNIFSWKNALHNDLKGCFTQTLLKYQ